MLGAPLFFGVARTDIVRLRPGPSGETIKTRAAKIVPRTKYLDAATTLRRLPHISTFCLPVFGSNLMGNSSCESANSTWLEPDERLNHFRW